MSSSPLRPGATIEQELDFYKSQYTQLEADLSDFQASSKELEEQLERDIEAAEKNERKLKEQVEKLNFEVEEWKSKHRHAKEEAGRVQGLLQKEVTTLREKVRGLEGRLRDVEVVNDDYERLQRNTEASHGDLEAKLNLAIERGVMQEEDIRAGELEREALRIETQRLRDELGDLRVESEINGEKLRLAESSVERLRTTRKPSPLAVENLRARSPAGSEGSGRSGITPSSTSTTASTPPPTSKSGISEDGTGTPPSPPLSDAPVQHAKAEPKTSVSRRSLLPDNTAATPRPSLYGPRSAAPTNKHHTRGPSIASSTGTSSSVLVGGDSAKAMRPPPSKPKRPSTTTTGEGLPRSDSLYQIKALRGRMQKIEERVHSARSKLPPPGTRTPTKSPRPVEGGERLLPGSVTMRRSMKRPSGSLSSSLAFGGGNEMVGTDGDVPADAPAAVERTARRESHVKRLSYGIPRPGLGERGLSALGERPASALGRPVSSLGRGVEGAGASSRPSSRGSLASAQRPESRGGGGGGARPESRGGLASRPESRTGSRMSGYVGTTVSSSATRPESRTGSRTSGVGGLYGASVINSARPESRTGTASSRTTAASTNGITHRATQPRASIGASTPSTNARPRSSMGGASNYATVHGTPRSHRPSASVSELRRKAVTDNDGQQRETPAFAAGGLFSSPSGTGRRTSGLPGLSSGAARKVGESGSGVSSPTGKTLRRVGESVGSGLNGVDGRGGGGEMRPPPAPARRKVGDVGETY
ncbi:NADH:ubiquinone oxidoreductase [Elasticomyces elasticus]|nr:NADH:ubiquinone oxidoreductase [Elasticomyces elasticus]KAK3662206.1 NADH:ubiquinone oxidoreductase [Elasticomyces elasticus]KAK4916184.1 NADH:ubiquinone oxidoreductase [Elasticomyces elasticus]KAK5767969.1 NADH:ubiquinone oxidoreductase [Elasticomyces elasticus]